MGKYIYISTVLIQMDITTLPSPQHASDPATFLSNINLLLQNHKIQEGREMDSRPEYSTRVEYQVITPRKE